MMKGLDALVYDLQDTGCRFYTFISTMGVAMEACGAAGVGFIVFDRPSGGAMALREQVEPRRVALCRGGAKALGNEGQFALNVGWGVWRSR